MNNKKTSEVLFETLTEVYNTFSKNVIIFYGWVGFIMTNHKRNDMCFILFKGQKFGW